MRLLTARQARMALNEARAATLQIEASQEQRESMSSLLRDGDQVSAPDSVTRLDVPQLVPYGSVSARR